MSNAVLTYILYKQPCQNSHDNLTVTMPYKFWRVLLGGAGGLVLGVLGG